MDAGGTVELVLKVSGPLNGLAGLITAIVALRRANSARQAAENLSETPG